MIIKDIKSNRILPFEIEDVKLVKLFSFYLHSAPTIESKTAAQIDSQRLLKNWLNFKTRYPSNVLTFFSASYSNDNFMKSLVKYKINEEAQVNRKTKVIVCKKKDTKETEPQCLLRHLRNSIAHNNVYISNAGNRKYILFEDFNKNRKLTARILLSQTDLTALKREIMK